MVKVEGFKNKITKAQEDLFKALETEKEKKKTLSDKIVQELSKQEKANVRTLNSLNKEYLEECANNEKQVEIFVEEIKSLNEQLQLSIEEFNQYYQDNDKLAQMKEENEANVVVAKNKFRREIQDINIKIDRIDKELKETIETRTNDYNEQYNTFKNKVVEFDKRKKYDITRIQSNTIKEYDNLQKLLSKENKKSEIKNIRKKIKQIRYSGKIEEKECIFRYLAEQRQYELDFAKYEYDYKCENSNLTQTYTSRIEDTKFDRSMIELNYKKSSDKNGNDLIHAFNENDKQYKTNYIEKLNSFYNSINDKTNEQYNFEKEKNNKETELIKRIYQDIENNDVNQGIKLIDLTGKELTLINKDLTLFHKNINLTITFYIQNIISTYSHYFKTYVKKEEVFINSLIINSMKGSFLQGNEYTEFVDKVKEIFTTFKENEEKYIETFNQYLHNALNNLIVQVESFINQINELNTTIIKIANEYHESINKVLNEAKEKGYNFIEVINNNNINEINTKVEKNKVLFDERMESSNKLLNEYNNEFNNREAEVKKVEDILNIQYQDEYSKIDKVKQEAKDEINNKYNIEVAQYLADYNLKCQNINIKFDDEIKKVEKQYKEKMESL